MIANLHLHSLHLYRPLGVSRSCNSDPKKNKKEKAVASVSFLVTKTVAIKNG